MEVVINVCHGGFDLSDAAIERCVALGMRIGSEEELNAGAPLDFFRWSDLTAEAFGCKFTVHDDPDTRNALRSDPRVVRVVREMGDAANGTAAKLKIIDIPFTDTAGWEIVENGGWEHVAEIHRTWS